MLNHNGNHNATASTVDFINQYENSEQKRPPVRRWVRPLLIIVLALMVAAIASVLLASLVYTGLPVGTAAPKFQGQGLNGEKIDLATYSGQPVMLTFWSPDCSVCVKELPELQALADDPNAEMQLITVVSYMERTKLNDFVTEQNLTFPIIVDPAGTIAQQYEVQGVPFTYFIDQNGLVDQAVLGGGNEGELQNQLVAWLESCQIDEVCSVE